VKEYDFQRELMHHFVTHTATTLVFSPELWRGPLLCLSLQVCIGQLHHLFQSNAGLCSQRFVFRLTTSHNAILMIAATHRSVLAASIDPQRDQYHHAARNYLAKTLHGYQDALSNPISSTPGDALIAVSLLLYHYAWSSVDQAAVPLAVSESPAISRELVSELDLSSDPLMNLSVGLRYLFWKTGALATDSESPFHTYALERPRVRIVEAVQRQQQPHNSLGQMESYLLGGYDSHGSSIVESTDSSEPQVAPDRVVDDPIALAAYSESAGRLAPILALMFSSVAIQDEPIISNGTNHDRGPAVRISDIIRYLFSYPIHFCHTFRSLVATHDRRALFLLLHFFRAVRRLLPADRCWWAQRRAMLLESQLECIIKVESAVPEQGAVERLSSLGLDAQGTECVSYPMRDWLNGECIHGQF
jgi:hypothetical protein